jgi:glycosyltransferase involved in cell wall biosynthesis
VTKVLFVHHTSMLGGAELHLHSVACAYRESSSVLLFGDGPCRSVLERDGVRVRVVASRWAQEGTRRGMPNVNVRSGLSVLRLAYETARFASGAELFYVNSPKALIVTEIAAAVVRRPVLWYLHDLFDPSHFSEAVIRQMVRRANRIDPWILANSHASAEAFASHGGRIDRLHVVPNGIDASVFDPTIDDRDATRRALGLGDSPVVGAFARLTSWKGQHVVIEALRRLPGVVLLLVGDDTEDPSYVERLRRMIDGAEVPPRVHILGFRTDVPRLMRACDVIVHAPVAPEPFGRVLVEGMLSGRPVVASNGGAAAEIVHDASTGLLVRPGSAPEMARALGAIISDPRRGQVMGAAGRQLALAQFSVECMLDRMHACISNAAGAGRHARPAGVLI